MRFLALLILSLASFPLTAQAERLKAVASLLRFFVPAQRCVCIAGGHGAAGEGAREDVGCPGLAGLR